MFNGNISMKFYDMSQFARSKGKKTVQRAHCAVEGCHIVFSIFTKSHYARQSLQSCRRRRDNSQCLLPLLAPLGFDVSHHPGSCPPEKVKIHSSCQHHYSSNYCISVSTHLVHDAFLILQDSEKSNFHIISSWFQGLAEIFDQG